MIKRREMKTVVLMAALAGLVLMASGCMGHARLSEDSTVLASVNGDPITIETFRERLNSIHQYKPMLPAEGDSQKINFGEILDGLIDEQLMIQEAYRMELDKLPYFVRQVEGYILNHSVTWLKKEQVQDKVRITEDEMLEYFHDLYDEIKVRQIFAQKREKAEAILKRLKAGDDFIEVEKQESEWENQKEGDIGFIRRGRMVQEFDTAAFAMAPGEISDVVETRFGFHIIRVDEKKEASEESYQKEKRKISKKLYKEKETEAAERYVEELKKRADIRIDRDAVDAVLLEQTSSEGDPMIAWVNDKPIPESRFRVEVNRMKLNRHGAMASAEEYDVNELGQKALDLLIAYEVVEQEALRRRYVDDSLFQKDLEDYRGKLLLNLFKQEIILPKAIPTEADLMEYYETNKAGFKTDEQVWFSEIIFPDSESASTTLNELKAGADFEFMASEKSMGRPGNKVWVPLGSLSPELRRVAESLAIGDISEVINDGRNYKIIKLKGKKAGETETFDRMKPMIHKVVAKTKFDTWLQHYLKKLRDHSSVVINQTALDNLSKRLWRSPVQVTQQETP